MLSRSEAGRWLGGVCAGIARNQGRDPAWIRVAFVAASLIGGCGVLVYLTCWLIVPREGEVAEGAGSGWIVVAVQASAGCVGIAGLAAAAAATLFGAGWIVAGLAAAVLIVVVVARPRFGPGLSWRPAEPPHGRGL